MTSVSIVFNIESDDSPATPVSDWSELKKKVESSDITDIELTGTNFVASEKITVSRDVTIDGNGIEITRGASNFNLFVISSGSLTLKNITLDGHYSGGSDTYSLVKIDGGHFILDQEAILQNNKASHGGAVHVNGGEFTLNGGEISNNTAIGNGGGIWISSGTFTMAGGKISSNTATGNNTTEAPFSGSGGGVYVSGGTFIMNGGEISNNTASGTANNSGNGGGVYLYSNSSNGVTFKINDGTISENKAEGKGIYQYGGGSGGGVFAYSKSVGGIKFDMVGGQISNNVSKNTGENNNGGGGGGIYLQGNGITFTMHGGMISDNEADLTKDGSGGSGGGVYASLGATFTMTGGEISENYARTSVHGGGGVCIANGSAKFTMTGGKISGNTANGYGGGVYVYTGGDIFTANGGEISGNTSKIGGGGVYINGGTFTMIKSSLFGNEDSTGYSDFRSTSQQRLLINFDHDGKHYYLFSGDAMNTTGTTTGNTEYVYKEAFIVKFDTGTGNDRISDEIVLPGGTITEIHLTNSENYTAMWCTEKNDSKTQWNFSVDKVNQDITLYALWGYIVSFDALGLADDPLRQSILNGDRAEEPSIEIEKHVVRGWYYDDGNEYTLWNFEDPVTGNLDLFLVLNDLVELIIDPKFDDSDKDGYMIIVRGDFEPSSIKNAVRTGYYPFGYYYWDDADETTYVLKLKDGVMKLQPDTKYTTNDEIPSWSYDFNGEPAILTADMRPNTYTVTYDNNGGSGKIVSDTATYDQNFTLSNGKGMKKTGYTLSGWNTTADGSGTSYALNETIEWNMLDSLDLYAVWTVNTYTVTYDNNGGNGKIVGDTATYDQNFRLSDGAGMTKTGYTLSGWNTMASGSGTSYALGQTLKPWKLTYNLNLYATWTANGYEVVLNANYAGGADGFFRTSFGASSGTLDYGVTRQGYELTGYFTSPTDGDKVLNMDGTFASPNIAGWTDDGKWSNSATSQTLYAVWKAVPEPPPHDGLNYMLVSLIALIVSMIVALGGFRIFLMKRRRKDE